MRASSRACAWPPICRTRLSCGATACRIGTRVLLWSWSLSQESPGPGLLFPSRYQIDLICG
jgi:hypothetical protein